MFYDLDFGKGVGLIHRTIDRMRDGMRE